MIRKILVALALVASVLLVPASPAQAIDATCSRPVSDADYLELIPLSYPDPHLTVAIHTSPQAKAEFVAAIYDAIRVWQGVLQDCFDGAVTLSITQSWAQADIRIQFVPMLNTTVGGVTVIPVIHGKADTHSTVFLKSDYPSFVFGTTGKPQTEPLQYFYETVLHELGHALGLGHAQPILESHDLMGYAEFQENSNDPHPILSQCDVDALAVTWTAFLASRAATPATYQC